MKLVWYSTQLELGSAQQGAGQCGAYDGVGRTLTLAEAGPRVAKGWAASGLLGRRARPAYQGLLTNTSCSPFLSHISQINSQYKSSIGSK